LPNIRDFGRLACDAQRLSQAGTSAYVDAGRSSAAQVERDTVRLLMVDGSQDSFSTTYAAPVETLI